MRILYISPNMVVFFVDMLDDGEAVQPSGKIIILTEETGLIIRAQCI